MRYLCLLIFMPYEKDFVFFVGGCWDFILK